MLKILILMSLCMNLAFARSRFSDSDKKKFMEEVRQGVAAHKIENKGKIDLQIFKPSLYEELDVYYKQEKFTREEMNKIKQNFEDFSKQAIPQEKVEEEFYGFITNQFDNINKIQLVKTKEGDVCNNWSCEDDLKCAPDPKQIDGQSCKKEGRECKDNGDCCSSACTINTKTKKGICEQVYRCFKPVRLGGSCLNNPVCAEGDCLIYNSKTSGIGECEDVGNSCKKNFDCCSNSCVKNKCAEAYVCKDCVQNGKKPTRGQKCCEGLYINSNGKCAPDIAPIVIPQVNIKSKFLDYIVGIFVSNASAESDSAKALKAAVIANKSMIDNPKSDAAPVAVTVVGPALSFTRKSDFKTCDVRFRDDFINYLKSEKLVDLEVALLSFDYMFLGDGENDYWTKDGNPETSIYGRLKKIATKHQLIRNATNAKIDDINHKLTCMCLDVIGYDNIADTAKKTFFANECDEFKVVQTGEVCTKLVDCTEQARLTNSCRSDDITSPDASATAQKMLQSCIKGEPGCTCQQSIVSSIDKENASGVKGKKLLVNWTQNLVNFNSSLAVNNTDTYLEINNVAEWTSGSAKWDETSTKQYTLFNFDVQNPSGSAAALGALLGAILAAGVIAILGGFATSSILTAWAAAGIIGASAVTGGVGMWMIGSLKGAWISKRPEIVDNNVRTYSCGKKDTCVEYSRVLTQPYNDICSVHTSANACIKDFAVDKDENYLVDPWVPLGVSRALILKDSGGYAKKMEKGFQDAKSLMMSLKPIPGASGSKGSGSYVSEDYLSTTFIDAEILGKYAPKISENMLSDEAIKEIKTKAIKYGIDQKFFVETDTDNLNKFADYVYKFHFVWPKTTKKGEVSYPTVGLSQYLEFMGNGVTANLAVGATNAAKTFGLLNTQYLEDYKKTLLVFSDAAVSTDQATLLKAEIDKTQENIDSMKVVSALANNVNLDTQLVKVSSSDVNSAAKTQGVNGTVSLTSSQKSLLNAIGKLRIARKSQLQKLAVYNKAMKDSGNENRAIKVASASKNFSAIFGHPLSGSGSLGNSSQKDGGSSDANSANASDESKFNKTKINFDNFSSGSGSGSSGARYSNRGSGGGHSDKDDKPSSDSSSGSGNDEDSRRISAAIEARDKLNKDKYKSNDEQTIFEKVTNAYIRNYDKILTKKKDRDNIEQNQQ